MGDLLDRSLGGNVSVEADTPEDLWPVHADQTALQLAILNLAVNARDAMPEGGTSAISARTGALKDPSAAGVSSCFPT
jgi:signal transduction histidine kinase